jgi:hypothetical protein
MITRPFAPLAPTRDGYPSFLVTGNVKSLPGYGMGSYRR